MGPDPDTSVVDGFGFAHEAPNLGILGASTFPTLGGHNPPLTVQALARRSAALAPRVAAVLEGGYDPRTLPALVRTALEGFRE